jgi:hypothetical protein
MNAFKMTCLMVTLLVGGLVFQAPAIGQSAPPMQWSRTAHGPVGEASVSVRATVLQRSDRLFAFWRTDTGYTPRTAISRLLIRVSGREVWVPLDCALGAYDPHNVRLSVAPEGFVLEIEGGDAAEGYTERLWFDATGVLRLEVSGETGEVSQTTRYNHVSIE